MGKALAITANGQHKIGKKLFITDKNYVHRKVKKAFITQGGVHKLIFSSGAVWSKWKCYVDTRTYEEHTRTSYMVGNTTTDYRRYDDLFYGAYSFSTYRGFEGVGSSHEFPSGEGVYESALVGMYIVYETEVYKITSLDNKDGDYYYVTCTIVDACDVERYTEHYYHQGSDYFGTVEAEDGELPEEGNLVDGSPTDWYCVLNVNNNYYYYKKEGE